MPRNDAQTGGTRHGLARVLSKAGLCSRSQASQWIREGRVALHGRCIRNPEHPVQAEDIAGIRVDGQAIGGGSPRYLMLNKPRGLVTTAHDEQGRETVYACFHGQVPGWVAPVGRLDKASEGLLLFTNDPVWAAAITDPACGARKTYHVQTGAVPDATQLAAMLQGVDVADERLSVTSVSLLRSGGKTAWLQIELDEGRNRQIRRVLDALGLPVKRLLRVAIGDLRLGELGKGQWRDLQPDEVAALVPSMRARSSGE